MTAAGVLRLFRTKPQQAIGADGRMALADHLRELRARLLIITLLLTVGIIVAWFFYDPLFNLLLDPYEAARRRLAEKGVRSEPVVNGVATSLLLRLKISALAAVVATSPFWLYQIWGFIVPGLHPHEKKWTKLFAVVAGPLFVAGVAVAYYVLPKGMEVLIGFTPGNLTSLIDFGDYFRFLTRMMLVFGIAFEIPLFVVMLNLAGVLSGTHARGLPALDRPRHVRLRRGRHPVDRPVLDDHARHPDDRAVPALGGHRPGRRPASRRPGRQLRRHRRRRGVAAGAGRGRRTPSGAGRGRLVTAAPEVSAVDPFDLPDWLGTDEVTWTARTSVHGGPPGRGRADRRRRRRSAATCSAPTRPSRCPCSTTSGAGRRTRRGPSGRCCSWSTTAG